MIQNTSQSPPHSRLIPLIITILLCIILFTPHTSADEDDPMRGVNFWTNFYDFNYRDNKIYFELKILSEEYPILPYHQLTISPREPDLTRHYTNIFHDFRFDVEGIEFDCYYGEEGPKIQDRLSPFPKHYGKHISHHKEIFEQPIISSSYTTTLGFLDEFQIGIEMKHLQCFGFFSIKHKNIPTHPTCCNNPDSFTPGDSTCKGICESTPFYEDKEPNCCLSRIGVKITFNLSPTPTQDRSFTAVDYHTVLMIPPAERNIGDIEAMILCDDSIGFMLPCEDNTVSVRFHYIPAMSTKLTVTAIGQGGIQKQGPALWVICSLNGQSFPSQIVYNDDSLSIDTQFQYIQGWDYMMSCDGVWMEWQPAAHMNRKLRQNTFLQVTLELNNRKLTSIVPITVLNRHIPPAMISHTSPVTKVFNYTGMETNFLLNFTNPMTIPPQPSDQISVLLQAPHNLQYQIMTQYPDGTMEWTPPTPLPGETKGSPYHKITIEPFKYKNKPRAFFQGGFFFVFSLLPLDDKIREIAQKNADEKKFDPHLPSEITPVDAQVLWNYHRCMPKKYTITHDKDVEFLPDGRLPFIDPDEIESHWKSVIHTTKFDPTQGNDGQDDQDDQDDQFCIDLALMVDLDISNSISGDLGLGFDVHVFKNTTSLHDETPSYWRVNYDGITQPLTWDKNSLEDVIPPGICADHKPDPWENMATKILQQKQYSMGSRHGNFEPLSTLDSISFDQISLDNGLLSNDLDIQHQQPREHINANPYALHIANTEYNQYNQRHFGREHSKRKSVGENGFDSKFSDFNTQYTQRTPRSARMSSFATSPSTTRFSLLPQSPLENSIPLTTTTLSSTTQKSPFTAASINSNDIPDNDQPYSPTYNPTEDSFPVIPPGLYNREIDSKNFYNRESFHFTLRNVASSFRYIEVWLNSPYLYLWGIDVENTGFQKSCYVQALNTLNYTAPRCAATSFEQTVDYFGQPRRLDSSFIIYMSTEQGGSYNVTCPGISLALRTNFEWPIQMGSGQQQDWEPEPSDGGDSAGSQSSFTVKQSTDGDGADSDIPIDGDDSDKADGDGAGDDDDPYKPIFPSPIEKERIITELPAYLGYIALLGVNLRGRFHTTGQVIRLAHQEPPPPPPGLTPWAIFGIVVAVFFATILVILAIIEIYWRCKFNLSSIAQTCRFIGDRSTSPRSPDQKQMLWQDFDSQSLENDSISPTMSDSNQYTTTESNLAAGINGDGKRAGTIGTFFKAIFKKKQREEEEPTQTDFDLLSRQDSIFNGSFHHDGHNGRNHNDHDDHDDHDDPQQMYYSYNLYQSSPSPGTPTTPRRQQPDPGTPKMITLSPSSNAGRRSKKGDQSPAAIIPSSIDTADLAPPLFDPSRDYY